MDELKNKEREEIDELTINEHAMGDMLESKRNSKEQGGMEWTQQ